MEALIGLGIFIILLAIVWSYPIQTAVVLLPVAIFVIRHVIKGRRQEALDRIADEKRAAEAQLIRSKAEARWQDEEKLREAERQLREAERQLRRDSDSQDQPYVYEVGQHANEALAIRYGIANTERQIEEYWYYARGGEKKRNSSRDIVSWIPSRRVSLRKIRALGSDQFIAELTEHGNRNVRVVIERGTEYVKTFLPVDDQWFVSHGELELTLKHNGTFSLKELATFHVQSKLRHTGLEKINATGRE